MTVSAAEYLSRMGTRRYDSLPGATVGTMRLDIRDEGRTDHWNIAIRDQRVTVTRTGEEADLVVRADREVFDRLVNGRTHIAVSFLRGEVAVEGNLRLLMMLRRLFPGPAGARHPREAAREAVRAHHRPEATP